MYKSVLRSFGVALVAACSLMAMFAVAAQAENLTDGGKAGYFTVLSLKSLVAGAEVTGEQIGAGKLLIPSKNAYVECKKGKVINAKGLNENEVLGTVRFEECAAFNLKTGAALTACPVLGEPSAKTIDGEGIILSRLHGEELFVLIHPDGEKPLATIVFGPECGIGVKVKVSGLLAGLVHEGSAEVPTHLVLFSQAIQELLGAKLLYGAAESFIDGEAKVLLAGAHAGCTWALH